MDALGLDEIKVELPVNVDNNLTKHVGSQKLLPISGTLHNKSGSAGSGLDSYNDDDEIEDENRNPAAM